MFTATEAVALSKENDEMWADFQKKQDDEIKRACEKGLRSALWWGDTLPYVRNEDSYKAKYKAHGYTFKPIGMCGGVWQEGKYICW